MTTTTEPYAVSEAYYEVKPKYKEVVYDKPNNPDHHEIPEAPKEYVTKKYDKPTYKPKSYEPKYEGKQVKLFLKYNFHFKSLCFHKININITIICTTTVSATVKVQLF